ncbi:toxin VasX [Billgrantia kenyensis]|uniref:Toxin VasX N-terminal region domain-containing protein n=1 Tax=Billgrantia kenyensis TaxID=321266 RepID=A0A7V9VYX7_9GAMM|nr:toxin VasX [Halomonas kenyensis]MBA2778003.1 hypothetical protein [Halomonas kenyensis]MCG6661474.1 hypothetical protein [Halomonas kenyensis]
MSHDRDPASRVADSQSDNDPGQEQGVCPLTRSDLQLVPVRYALVEDPEADRASATPGFSPVHNGSFRRCGVRPIREGWLYLVHSSTPDELQVFQVKPDGSGDAIIVEREGSIQVLFSLLELTEVHQSMLRQAAFRDQVMTRVNVGAYCPGNGTAHLLDPNALADVLADDHGEHSATPNAPTEQSGEALDPGSYAWCEAEGEQPEWQLAHAAEITAAIQGEYQEDSACLVVEDIAGRIKDLAQAWACLAEQQGNWVDENEVKLFSARTIESLMTLNFAPHIANAGGGNIPEWLGGAGDAERDDLEALAELYTQHRETKERVTAGSGGHPGFIGGALRPIERDIDALSQQLAERLGTDAEQVKTFVERTERDHFREVIGGNFALAPNGIVDVIRQQEMENFLAYANPMQEQWQSDYRLIGADLATILPAWHIHAVLLDREAEPHILLSCLVEKLAVETLLACGQEVFLSGYYTGTTPAAAHLMHYVPTESFVEEFLSQSDGVQKALTQTAVVMSARGALSSYQLWRGEVEQHAGLRFRSVEGLSDEVRTAIAGEVQLKEKLLGQAVLKTLLDDIQDIDLGQRIATLASRLPEGQRLMFAERLGLLELGWDIPDQSVLGRLQQALGQADRAVANLTTLERRLQQLYQERQLEMDRASRRGASQAHRRAADQFNARRIRESQADINRQKRLLAEALDTLAEHSFPVDEGNGHALKVGGLSQAATRAALAERGGDRAIARQPRHTLNDTLNTLVRNEQGDLSVGRSLGVLLNGGLSMLSGIYLISALQTLRQSGRSDEQLFEHISNAGSHAMGTLAGLWAIREMIDDARHRNLYKNYIKQLTPVEARAAAGSPAQLERWAKVANRAMGTVALLGGAAGAFETYKQYSRLQRAETQAERLATQVAMSGAAGVTGGGAIIGVMSRLGRIMGRPAVSWRLLLLKFAGPAGWVVAAGTVLLIAGEVLANRFSLSPVQRWCQRSYWGLRGEGWDREAHEEELAKLGDTGLLVQRQGQASAHGGPGPGPAASDLAIRIELPGFDAPSSESLSLGVWGVALSGSHDELTQDFLTHAKLEENGASFALMYHIDPDRLSRYYSFRLVVRTAGSNDPATQVFELHKRGSTLSGEWRALSSLSDSFWTRSRVGNWPNMPLTDWQ